MSVSLFVSFRNPVSLGNIESVSSTALRDLLNLKTTPAVKARFDQAARIGLSFTDPLNEDSKRVICSLLGHEEEVSLSPLKIPIRAMTLDDSWAFSNQNFLSVKWEYRKTPLNFVLSAAIALGIARNQNSEIQDNAGFYALKCDTTVDEFLAALRLPTPQTDMESAARELYRRMPKSIQIPDRSARPS